MMREDKDALICDFAETYHIYDLRSLPLSLVATLAAGLGDNSRIVRNTTEAKASTTNTLLAIIADRIGSIQIMLSGEKNIPSVVDVLYDIQREQKGVKGFHTGKAFEAAWREINEG